MEKLKEIIDGIRDNKFLLPNFQREFVWNFKQQKDLIASVISSVPASSSLLVEEENFKNPKFDCIKVGQRSSKLSIEHQKPFYYILDGQQRFTTLYYAFTNAFNSSVADNEATFKRLDNKLKVRWFLKFESESGFLFNYDTLIFNKEHFEKYLPNDLFDFISEEKILINSIRKEADSYTQHLKSESLSDNKIPLHLFLMEDDESYRLKEWLKEIQQDRISNLKNKSENKSSLVKLFEFFSLDEPNKIADALYQDEETAIKVFEDCVKNVKVDNWHDKVYNYIKDKIKDYEIKPIVLDDMFKAISTFEYINTRGTDLSTFDLLCAKAGTTFDLRKKVIERSGETFDFYNNNFDDKK
ncbi:MAG: DUF262 domain-containing protein [Psychroflexus halocasei]